MTDLFRLLFFAFALVLALGLVSGYIKNRTALSEPFVAIAFGFLLGPHMLDSIHLEAIAPPHSLIKYVALFTIALTVHEAALRVPHGWLRRHFTTPLLFLCAGMVAMWLAGAGLAALVFGLSLWPALLLGAILAPTDPVLSDSVVNSRIATQRVPVGLRHSLTVESGANDGLALPLVALPILMLGAGAQPWHEFGRQILVQQVLGGVALGLGAGLLVGFLNTWAGRMGVEASQSQKLVTLALTVMLASLGELLHVSGIIAAFVSGVVFSALSSHAVIRAQENFDDTIKRAFELPIFFMLGVYMPVDAWAAAPWQFAGFALMVICLRRPPAFMLLARFTGLVRDHVQAGYIAWFGPIGIAALYYAAHVEERLGDPFYLHVTSLVIAVSALLHGITAEPVARHMREYEEQRTEG